MMMTLKLMGLAFEVFDSEEVDTSLEHKYRKINPSILDMFHYTFTHAGILTGQLKERHSSMPWGQCHKGYV